MIDKIYYGVILTVLTGLVIWSIKSFVGKALEGMAKELGHVHLSLDEVKANVKENIADAKNEIRGSTIELKKHFDKTCSERQTACTNIVTNRIRRLENHGHVGLKGEDAKITG